MFAKKLQTIQDKYKTLSDERDKYFRDLEKEKAVNAATVDGHQKNQDTMTEHIASLQSEIRRLESDRMEDRKMYNYEMSFKN